MKQLIDALAACKTDMPDTANDYKNQPKFAEGFDEALRLLVGLTVTRPELVNEIKKLTAYDIRTDLEQRAINLRERIAVVERQSNKLAASGQVKDSNNLEDSLATPRFELCRIADVLRYLSDYTDKL